MKQKELVGEAALQKSILKTKSNERNCPKCEHILILNENEQCYECLNCGYIECGDDD